MVVSGPFLLKPMDDDNDSDELELFDPSYMHARQHNEQHALGTFSLEDDTGGLVVSDPCYEDGTWCTHRIPNAVSGQWHAFTERADCGDLGLRIAALEVRHESVADVRTLAWTEAGCAGVDSGQCGVWRADTLLGHGEADEEDSFYGRACDATSYPPPSGSFSSYGLSRGSVMPEGAVSSSGFGDGGYPILVACDAQLRCVAVRVEYMEPTNTMVNEADALRRHVDESAAERQRMLDLYHP